jgi:hypothetical protein
VETLAITLGESVATLAESIEPFLLQQGLIRRTARGRIAIDKAQQVFQQQQSTKGTMIRNATVMKFVSLRGYGRSRHRCPSWQGQEIPGGENQPRSQA